ncbi:hypothetical protein [Alkalihalobacillus trypoxylicola]|uniref:Uncharacterized protein n=1 Tax=Alkalihalobacillus trypoxylicola TaxID=519424 RepID=A0A162DH35_9BACI|nr:hypothetical protein [Alkalihalobacillus trypoxylicola]KYG29615.1 hypothetical protein AZF04_08865 [Alkalihalobacillus trypoxylicola]
MKKLISTITCLSLITVAPLGAFAQSQGKGNTNIQPTDLELLYSNEGYDEGHFFGSEELEIIEDTTESLIYEYEEEGIRYHVIETETQEGTTFIINTQIYKYTDNNLVLVDEVETAIVEGTTEGEIIIIQDNDTEIIDTSIHEEVEEEPSFGIMSGTRGGSYLAQVRWVDSGNSKKQAWATVYPGNQKKTTSTNSNFKTFKSQANTVKSKENNLITLGGKEIISTIIGLANSGKIISMKTLQTALKLVKRSMPIISIASAAIQYGNAIKKARATHKKI